MWLTIYDTNNSKFKSEKEVGLFCKYFNLAPLEGDYGNWGCFTSGKTEVNFTSFHHDSQSFNYPSLCEFLDFSKENNITDFEQAVVLFKFSKE